MTDDCWIQPGPGHEPDELVPKMVRLMQLPREKTRRDRHSLVVRPPASDADASEWLDWASAWA